MRRIYKPTAVAVILSLVAAAPGAAPYQALAQTNESKAVAVQAPVAPLAVPSALSAPSAAPLAGISNQSVSTLVPRPLEGGEGGVRGTLSAPSANTLSAVAAISAQAAPAAAMSPVQAASPAVSINAPLSRRVEETRRAAQVVTQGTDQSSSASDESLRSGAAALIEGVSVSGLDGVAVPAGPSLARSSARAAVLNADEGAPAKAHEARLGKLSVSSALEGVLEDIPNTRAKVLAALSDAKTSRGERMMFWREFGSRLREALFREGVPSEVIPRAVAFVSEVDRAFTMQGMDEASSLLLYELKYPALPSLNDRVYKLIPASVKKRGLEHWQTEAKAIALELENAGITPTAVLVAAAFQRRGAPGWRDAAGLLWDVLTRKPLDFIAPSPHIGVMEKILARSRARRAVKADLALTRELETREPDPFNDREVDLFYSVLSKRLDLSAAGYYGYRKRVDAAAAFLKRGGVDAARWLDAKGFEPFSLQFAFEPFDVTRVDRKTIVEHRARVARASEAVQSLSILDDPRLDGVRDELIQRTWAYSKLWPLVQNDPKHKDAQGRAIPLASKAIRRYIEREGDGVSIEAMRSQLKNGGQNLSISLYIGAAQLAVAEKAANSKTQGRRASPALDGLHELLFKTMIGFQWLDEVARAEVNAAAADDTVGSWAPVDVALALQRLDYIYFDKTQEFQAFRAGMNASDEVKLLLQAGRRAIKAQLDKVHRNEPRTEDVAFVPAFGVSALFRGFPGRDCSKSLAPERGRLSLRAMDPHAIYYYGMVGGKAVGYVQLVEARKNGRPALLVEILQFLERESMTTALLTQLDKLAKAKGYDGIAVPSSLWPWDNVAKEQITNFSNFKDTVKAVREFKPYVDGETFKPEFPHAAAMAHMEAELGRVPYFSWNVGDGTYKLLKFDADPKTETGPPAVSAPSSTDAAAREERGKKILAGYFKGQMWFLTGYSVYYSLFGAVAGALGGDEAVGSARSGYTGAVALLSPLGGVLAERFPAREILRASLILRAAIWAGLVPLAYYTLSGAGFLTALAGLMFVDGVVVSVNALVDLDEGGMDLIATQHGFTIDDATRNKLNSRFESWLALCRTFLPPAMAGLGIVAASAMNSAAGALLGVMAVTFIVSGAMAFWNYTSAIPAEAHFVVRGEKKKLGDELRQIRAEFMEGVRKAWDEKRLRYRFLFYGLERAIDDAMLMVVLTAYAMKALAPGAPAWAALYAAVLIATGKLGALISAELNHKLWKEPKPGEPRYNAYRVYFPMAFAAMLATLLIPASLPLVSAGRPLLAAGVVGFGNFLYNLLYTPPSIGFRNLMQAIAKEQEASGRVFGIAGTVLMGTSGAVTFALGLVFAAFSLSTALWLTTGLFALYGLFQLVAAPRLLFTPAERSRKALQPGQNDPR